MSDDRNVTGGTGFVSTLSLMSKFGGRSREGPGLGGWHGWIASGWACQLVRLDPQAAQPGQARPCTG